MPKAFIVFPDVILDSLEKGDSPNAVDSRNFLSTLLSEKEKVSTSESKDFKGFLSHHHWNCLIGTILEMINPTNGQTLTDDEINTIQTAIASLDRDGIEAYPYKDNITPLLDLAKDKSDSYDVALVTNNPTIKSKIREMINAQSHFEKSPILSAGDALFSLK